MAAKIYSRLFGQIRARGEPAANARRIAQAVLTRRGHLKAGTLEPTAAGTKRGNMSAGARAIDREAKRTGDPASSFRYNPRKNSAIKRPKRPKRR